jgi:hypothetical protein
MLFPSFRSAAIKMSTLPEAGRAVFKLYWMGLNYQQKRGDFVLLFVTRMLRMFSFGMLAVVFFNILFYLGLDNYEASWLQAGTVFSSIVTSLALTTCADCIGRVNALALASFLMLVTAIFYA